MKATVAIQSAFKASNEELTQSINFLNAVENQTSTSLQDLVEAIPRAGSVVEGLGGSIKDLALYMVAMREGGVAAGEAANALKSGLISLINPSTKAQKELKAVGINLDAIVEANQGDLTQTILDFKDALSGLDDLTKSRVTTTLFGKYQANRMLTLINNIGEAGSQTQQVFELIGMDVEKLADIADQELSAITNSTGKKFEIMVATLKETLIPIGEAMLKVFTAIGNALAPIFEWVSSKPAILWFVGIAAAGAALVSVLLMLVGLTANLFGNLMKIARAGKGAFLTLKGLMTGVAPPPRVYEDLDMSMEAARLASDALTERLDIQGVAFGKLTAAIDLYQQKLNKLMGSAASGTGKSLAGLPFALPAPGTPGYNFIDDKKSGRVRQRSDYTFGMTVGESEKPVQVGHKAILGVIEGGVMAALSGLPASGGINPRVGRADTLPPNLMDEMLSQAEYRVINAEDMSKLTDKEKAIRIKMVDDLGVLSDKQRVMHEALVRDLTSEQKEKRRQGRDQIQKLIGLDTSRRAEYEHADPAETSRMTNFGSSFPGARGTNPTGRDQSVVTPANLFSADVPEPVKRKMVGMLQNRVQLLMGVAGDPVKFKAALAEYISAVKQGSKRIKTVSEALAGLPASGAFKVKITQQEFDEMAERNRAVWAESLERMKQNAAQLEGPDGDNARRIVAEAEEIAKMNEAEVRQRIGKWASDADLASQTSLSVSDAFVALTDETVDATKVRKQVVDTDKKYIRDMQRYTKQLSVAPSRNAQGRFLKGSQQQVAVGRETIGDRTYAAVIGEKGGRRVWDVTVPGEERLLNRRTQAEKDMVDLVEQRLRSRPKELTWMTKQTAQQRIQSGLLAESIALGDQHARAAVDITDAERARLDVLNEQNTVLTKQQRMQQTMLNRVKSAGRWMGRNAGYGMMAGGMALSMIPQTNNPTGQAATNIGGMVAMGAGSGMMFGPQGAAIGAAIGITAGLFMELNKALQKNIETLEKHNKALGASQTELTVEDADVIKSFGGEPREIKYSITPDPSLYGQVESVNEEFQAKVVNGFVSQIEAIKNTADSNVVPMATKIYNSLLLNGIPQESAAAIVQEILRQADREELVLDATVNFTKYKFGEAIDPKALAQQIQAANDEINRNALSELGKLDTGGAGTNSSAISKMGPFGASQVGLGSRLTINALNIGKNVDSMQQMFVGIGENMGESLVEGINAGMYDTAGNLDMNKVIQAIESKTKQFSIQLEVQLDKASTTSLQDQLKKNFLDNPQKITSEYGIDPDEIKNVQDLGRAYLNLSAEKRDALLSDVGKDSTLAFYLRALTTATDGFGTALGKTSEQLQALIDTARGQGKTELVGLLEAIKSSMNINALIFSEMDKWTNNQIALLETRKKAATAAYQAASEQAQGAQEKLAEQNAAALDKLREAERARIDAMKDAADERQKQMQKEIDATKERYDKEIDKIKQASDAKQKAFDREQELAERAAKRRSDQISLQEAIAGGDLFAAARIRNDMAMQEQQWQTADDKAAAADAADKKINKLEAERDAKVKTMQAALDKQKELDQQAIESAEKASEKKIKASEKAAKAAEDAAEKAAAAQLKSLNAQIEAYETWGKEATRILSDNSKTWAEKMTALAAFYKKTFGEPLPTEMTQPIVDAFKRMPGDIKTIIEQQIAAQKWSVLAKELFASSYLSDAELKSYISALNKGLPVRLGWTKEYKGKAGAYILPGVGQVPKDNMYMGGLVTGPGSGRSDSVPKNLSNGEFVVRAESVNRVGLGNLNRINKGEPIKQVAGIGGGGDLFGKVRRMLYGAAAFATALGAINLHRQHRQAMAGTDFGPGGSQKPAETAGSWGYPFGSKYPITSHYGARRGSRRHTGTDIGAPYGTPILSIGNGRLLFMGEDPSKAAPSQSFSGKSVSWMGNMVSLSHNSGVSSAYGHMSRFAPLSDGQTIRRGQIIGYVGSTGNSTGPHLHLGMRAGDGTRLNPELIIPGLLKGGRIKFDNTLVNAHKGETVLTEPLSRKLEQNIEKSPTVTYNVKVEIDRVESDVDIERALMSAFKKHNQKMGYGRVVR
jgi:TP901 family phage tail tape measure protein